MKRALLQAWEKTCRRKRDVIVLTEAAGGAKFSCGELDLRSRDWLACCGQTEETLRGRAVVFAQANGVVWMELFLGLIRAGAVIVPLDAGEPVAAQREIALQIRAGFWWNGRALEALPRARKFPDTTGLIKVTSGSTGRPKALLFRDEQILADARCVTATMGITEHDVNYALIPFGHSYGLGNLVGPLVLKGVPAVCGASPLPHGIAGDFEQWSPTVFPSVPALWRSLASSDVTLPGLRLAISAGAVLPIEVAEAFAQRFDQRIHGFYGSSETGGIAYDRTGEATLAGSVGTAMRGVILTVLRGQRLRVSSPAVITHGNRQQGNRELGAFVMSDRAEIDAGGRITLLGRRGRTVKIAGRRVNLEEVAVRLRGVAGVREAWAEATAEGVLGAAVVSDLTVHDLRAALHGKVAAWKIPKRLIALKEFPLTERGKTDTQALRVRVFGET
ncbi:class I adenylate-forming enzyme family protein [Oleiharenicola lentus]|uniref:class I adenylate-forming enzyme family protein n=1 Tax=Oleiharenicola lentus TaxID=2508720 RepID=UPI003F67BD33